MIPVNPSQCIIRKQIERVNFGFYSDSDVRSRSVCEITSSMAVDAMGTPLPNGVYDPRLGPTTTDSPPCPTCAQRYLGCPGHFGHIELCVPLYQPLLFQKMLDLLKMKCFNCHKLNVTPRTIKVFKTKFELLQHGEYSRAKELDSLMSAAVKEHIVEGKKKDSLQAAGAAVDKLLSEITASLKPDTMVPKYSRSAYEEEFHRELAKEFIAACKLSKCCPYCGAHSPKIRHDSFNKVFQSPLSATARRLNEAEGIKLEPALSKIDAGGGQGNGGDAGYDSDDTHREETMMETPNDLSPQDSGRDKYMHPSEVQAQIRRTWETSPELCAAVFAVQGCEIFFMQAIPVPPNRFRPPMHLGGMVVEHAQNGFLNKLILSNESVRSSFVQKKEGLAYKHWIQLQTFLNCLLDSAKDPSINADQVPGIRQLLERKEGIFRKHMMGKRVNYACRSVISPDPYIGTNEIGIPRHFAVTLTYPTPVTDINIEEMRNLVERGPSQWPGARWVEFPDRRVDLSKMDNHQREAVAARLLMYAKKGGRPAIVGRQMRDGDMVLMNRQPTLHKPGIMAHEVRVLHDPTQKTIRMHYANCNTYNADYDGDEMNCHFPQSDLGRAEAEYIAKTDLQFIVPTDGSPLRGLIQDHVVAGVKLTKRDTFLQKWEYQQLLFAALASLPRLEVIRSNFDIELMPPAILKPRPLWTGKQVISTLLNHLRRGNDRDAHTTEPFPGISTERKAKTPGSAFGAKQEEHLVIIRDGELLRGVLDKAAFGSTDFSLVHAVHEAYGPAKAGLLLNALGRLFTAYLQFYSGHSCRMEDLILTKESDEIRRKLIDKAYNMGSRAAKGWADSEGGKVPIELDAACSNPLKPVEAASSSSKVCQLLSGNEGESNSAAFDGFMMSKLNPLASEIVKVCLPSGLAVPFPSNTFGIMVTTGAKGSIVNQSQVSCALGQQALEGRRVPRLSSGRTLPSFAPYDVNPRADGFVMDRFLTGVRPQEYFFHCMAGREGLVDTAVKTSRSGYLQRCLVKHLEELKVCYDYTVRNGEGGVVQFLYGEDGLDPTKASYLDCSDRSFVYIARNHKSLKRGQTALPNSSIELAARDSARSKASACSSKKDLLRVGDHVLARRLRVGSKWVRGALCEGWYDAIILRKDNETESFDLKYSKDRQKVKNVPLEINLGRGNAISSTCVLIKPVAADPILSSSRESHRLGSDGGCVSERLAGAASSALHKSIELKRAMKTNNLSPEAFGSLVAAKYGAALCAPGEAVGSIAAQSVGEPSTQMTLNTFHLAGAGANVTLGIPRLREIIMTASKSLKTPTMSVPLNADITDNEAIRLTRKFAKLTLNELIAGHRGITVTETLLHGDSGLWQRAYYVSLRFHPAERIKTAFGLTLKDIAEVVAKTFVPVLSNEMKRELRRSATEGDEVVSVEGGESSAYVEPDSKNSDDESHTKMKASNHNHFSDEDEDDDSVEAVGEEDGVIASRAQADTYGGKDDEEDFIVGDESSMGGMEEKRFESGGEDGTKPGVTFELAPHTAFIGNSSVKVDAKHDTIHLKPLLVNPSARPLLMVGLVEKSATRTLVRSRKNIDQAFINEEDGRGRCLQTAGINFSEIWQLDNVEHNGLMSNDIWAVRCAYGVEAARNTIVDQIRGVFGVYGIEVDPRHLSLIADYMTFSGGYTAMNRTGMKEISSPFLQMSFETTTQFLTQSALVSSSDEMNSPSSNIVVGKPIRHGTGAFSLLVK